MNPNEPAMVLGTVEMVNVEWIMQNTRHSVDGYYTFNDETQEYTVDYANMVAEKGCDSQMGDVIGAILNEGFKVPITLVPDYDDNGLTHGDGHHRMVAAILLCIDEIPVYWPEDDDYLPDISSDRALPNYPEWKGMNMELADDFEALWYSATGQYI